MDGLVWARVREGRFSPWDHAAVEELAEEHNAIAVLPPIALRPMQRRKLLCAWHPSPAEQAGTLQRAIRLQVVLWVRVRFFELSVVEPAREAPMIGVRCVKGGDIPQATSSKEQLLPDLELPPWSIIPTVRARTPARDLLDAEIEGL